MHRLVTTALDVLGVLVCAAGVYFAAEPWIGPAALLPAGVVVLGVSAWWGARADREPS
jgi:hypothetical protein